MEIEYMSRNQIKISDSLWVKKLLSFAKFQNSATLFLKEIPVDVDSLCRDEIGPL